jgi:predicted site-specific integrase-resolvase
MSRREYLKKAAKELGLAEWDLRQRAKSGRIPCLMSGNRYIFPIEQCEEWLEKEAVSNVHQLEEKSKQYGTLRKISVD